MGTEIRTASGGSTTAVRPADADASAWPEVAERVEPDGSERSSRQITRFLPVSTEAPAIARETLASLTDMLASELVRDAQLLVSELVTHRVRRPSSERGATLRLEVSLRATGVRVQVTDDARGSFSPAVHAGEPSLGWELQIVAEIADRWGIRRNGPTTVWFELDR